MATSADPNRQETPPASVLLHTCCGPCATHCADLLVEAGHRVALFFANANIHPEAEHQRRLQAARELATSRELPLVVAPYDHQTWLAAVRGLEQEPERGRRCAACLAHNLGLTAAYATDQGFDAFTTTLTVSPHKDSVTIFRIGTEFPAFLALDFKKKDGFRQSLAKARDLGLYRQDYCGCEFSLADRGR